MIRVITYNILAGGTNRVEPLTQVLQMMQPDLVGLIEASNEHVVQELAGRLRMDYRLSERGEAQKGQPVALLSRLPILAVHSYAPQPRHAPPLLSVQVSEPDGTLLTVLVTHLTANFSSGWRGIRQRRQEARVLLERMQAHQGTPHLLMGDFNCVAPGDQIKGSALLRFLTDEDLYFQLMPPKMSSASSHGLPGLHSVVPRQFRFIYPLLCAIPGSRPLSRLLDAFQWLYAPRGGIGLLTRAGYRDCFRGLHPKEPGWTWPSALPAGRIDYIFASPELAPRLCLCEVLAAHHGLPVNEASDHLPVFVTLQHKNNQCAGTRHTLHTAQFNITGG
jgi:endonuclease/exonuclease/phosphatase family metal-dependent hydrolase